MFFIVHAFFINMIISNLLLFAGSDCGFFYLVEISLWTKVIAITHTIIAEGVAEGPDF